MRISRYVKNLTHFDCPPFYFFLLLASTVLLIALICCVNGLLAGQTYEQLPHITHSIPSNLVKPSSSLRDAKPASFAGRRCSGHASPHLPHLNHAEDVVLDTISFWNTRSDELPLTTGTSRLYMANPIIGPPEIYFSGSPTGPPAASRSCL